MSDLSRESVTAIIEGLLGPEDDIPTVVPQLSEAFGGGSTLERVFVPGSAEVVVSDLVSELLEWQTSCSEDVIAAAVLARAAERLQGDEPNAGIDSLLDIAQERVGESAPLVAAQILFAQAVQAQARDGESAYQPFFSAGLELLPAQGTIFRDRLHQYAMFLSFRGRLKEAGHLLTEDEEDIVEEIDLEFGGSALSPVPAIRFFDAVETGRFHDAERLIDRLDEEGLASGPLEDLLGAYDSAMLVMRHVLTGRPGEPPADAMLEEASVAFWALVKHDRKTVYQLIEEADYAEIGTASTLFGYQSIRLALALRDQELARELLQQRLDLGLEHWLDGLLEARILLLEGQPTQASEAFCTSLRAAAFYDASDRLEFELRMAMELTPLQLVWLGHRIEAVAPFEVELLSLDETATVDQTDG